VSANFLDSAFSLPGGTGGGLAFPSALRVAAVSCFPASVALLPPPHPRTASAAAVVTSGMKMRGPRAIIGLLVGYFAASAPGPAWTRSAHHSGAHSAIASHVCPPRLLFG